MVQINKAYMEIMNMKKIAALSIAALIATTAVVSAQDNPPVGGLGGLTQAQLIALGIGGLVVVGVAADSGSH